MAAWWLSLVLLACVAGNIVLNQLAYLPTVWCQTLLFAFALPSFCVAAWAHRQVLTPGSAIQPKHLARWQWCSYLGVPAALALGLSIGAWQARSALSLTLTPAQQDCDLALTGVVQTLPVAVEGGVRFVFFIETLNGKPRPPAFPKLVALGWYAHFAGRGSQTGNSPQAEPAYAALKPAQRWAFTVRLRRPHGAINPDGFDAEVWLLEQGIRAQGQVRNGPSDAPPQLLQALVWRFNPLIDRVRAHVREVLQAHTAGWRYASVLVALVMGDQSPVSRDDWNLFNRSGISHLISISGLHITMIAAMVAAFAGWLWRRSPWMSRYPVPLVQAIAGVGGGYLYCLLAGWGVPAQRTLIMLAVFACAYCTRVRLSPVLSLSAAACVVCLWDPWASLSAGFWLSFGAVAFIFGAMSGQGPPAVAWPQQVKQAVHAQAAITLGQIPLTLAIFGQISVIAPLANALAIPLVSYAVAPLALLGSALVLLPVPFVYVGQGALTFSHFLFQILARYLQWLCQWPGAWLELPSPPLWAIVLGCAGCLWCVQKPGWPARVCGLSWSLVMLVWPVSRPPVGHLWVSALDIGQGMSLVLETHQTMMVFDTGTRFSGDTDAGSRVLVPFLRSRGYGTLPLLVLSHSDIDHAGGAASLMHALPVQTLLTSIRPGHPLLDGRQPDQRCEQGQTLDLKDLHIRVLSPPSELYDQPKASSNAHSCVLLATVGNHSVLLTGDVPARQEKALVAWAQQYDVPLHADLLVAPHHGSHTSSTETLIAAVRPRWVSMQLGYHNHFGHPHAAVVQRYRADGVTVVRSDQAGAVQWRFGAGPGETVLEQWRNDHHRYWYNDPEPDLLPNGASTTIPTEPPTTDGDAS